MTALTTADPLARRALSILSEIAASGIAANAAPDPGEIDRQQTALAAARRTRDAANMAPDEITAQSLRAIQNGPILHGIARLTAIAADPTPGPAHQRDYAACQERLLDAWAQLDAMATLLDHGGGAPAARERAARITAASARAHLTASP